MYKNQLQELAQRSCFNLPSYTCIREGPDHAPRFKATVNFNGEIFESPNYFNTLRQAEHAAAEVALNSLSTRGPSHSLAAKILDETGVYKNLLQEISQRVGAPLPRYTTYRSGLGHQPVFTGIVELAGITFTGEPAKNKKQAEKNAAMAAWSSLKQLAKETASSSSSEPTNNNELEQITIARALINYRQKGKNTLGGSVGPIPFTKKFYMQNPRPSSPQHSTATTSKILPLICQRSPHHRPLSPRIRHTSSAVNDKPVPLARPSTMENCRACPQPLVHPSSMENCVAQLLQSAQFPCGENWGARPSASAQSSAFDNLVSRPQRFPSAGAAPYVALQPYRRPCHGIAPPVTVRNAVPVFSAPPLPPPSRLVPQVMQAPPVRIAPPVCIRQSVSAYAARPISKEDPSIIAKNDLLTKPQEVPSNVVKGDTLMKQKQDPPVIEEEDPKKTGPLTNQKDDAPLTQTEDPLKFGNEDPLASVVPSPICPFQKQESEGTTTKFLNEAEAVKSLEQLKM